MEEIHVRLEGNNSSMYDGKTQDIGQKYVVEEDHANIAVGKSVKVKLGAAFTDLESGCCRHLRSE